MSEIAILENGEVEISCSQCGKSFIMHDSLTLCEECKNKPMTCEICGEEYARRNDFLFATLCLECAHIEAVNLAKNIEKIYPGTNSPILKMSKEEWMEMIRKGAEVEAIKEKEKSHE